MCSSLCDLGLSCTARETDAMNVVFSSGSDQRLRIAVDGSVQSVLQSDFNIYDLVVVDDTLVASVSGMGTLVSTDQGETWSLKDERQPHCLSAHDDQIWACPGDQSKVLWISTSLSSLSAGDPWTEGPSFLDVSGQRCGEVLEECDALWPQVEEQLSQSALSDAGEAVTDEDSEAGCRGRSGSAMLILPWWLLTLVRRKAA